MHIRHTDYNITRFNMYKRMTWRTKNASPYVCRATHLFFSVRKRSFRIYLDCKEKSRERKKTSTHQRLFKCIWIFHSRSSFMKSRWKIPNDDYVEKTDEIIHFMQIIFYSYIDQIFQCTFISYAFSLMPLIPFSPRISVLLRCAVIFLAHIN